MKVAIHQPNFLPWMGYFYKMSQCDTFVLLDHVEFTKKSFTKRVLIHDPNDQQKEKYLIVPTQKHSDFSPINQIKLLEDITWQKKLKTQIHQTYSKAPFYHQLTPIIDTFFINPRMSDSFSTFTIEIIQFIAGSLNLHPNWIISSELDLEQTGSNINLQITKTLGFDEYISGMGAKKYQKEEDFYANKINLRYSDFNSKFNQLPVDSHFITKSIISYLAYYDIQMIKRWLSK